MNPTKFVQAEGRSEGKLLETKKLRRRLSALRSGPKSFAGGGRPIAIVKQPIDTKDAPLPGS